MSNIGHNLTWYKADCAPVGYEYYAECSCSFRDDSGHPDAGWSGSVGEVVDRYAEHVEEVLV